MTDWPLWHRLLADMLIVVGIGIEWGVGMMVVGGVMGRIGR